MTTLSQVSIIGLYANLPVPGIKGRKYFATDMAWDLYDTGTAWVNINPNLAVPPAVIDDPDGASSYSLPSVPANPTASLYFVNGIKRKYGLFYSISGATLNLLIPTQYPQTGDTHEIYYS